MTESLLSQGLGAALGVIDQRSALLVGVLRGEWGEVHEVLQWHRKGLKK
jgi:hypothetical protein